MKKILWIILLFIANLPANSQPAITPCVGKAFADKNGASAIRMGLGFNQLYKNRWGLYYTYEYRSNVMFFENTPYPYLWPYPYPYPYPYPFRLISL